MRYTNYFNSQCRGRGSIRLDHSDFKLTRPHTYVPQRLAENNNDNQTAFIRSLRQRAVREQINIRSIYNEEIQRYLF